MANPLAPDLLAALQSSATATSTTPVRDRLAALPNLEARLASGLSRATQAHPALHPPPAAFLALVGRHLSSVDDPARVLDGLFWEDLWLAFACARGEEAALRTFEKHFIADLPAALAHLRRDAAFISEVAQLLRAKLLVADPPASPKILTYSGRGPLVSWVRVAAVRLAFTLMEKDDAPSAPNAGDGQASDPLVAVARIHDVEFDHLRNRFGPEFKVAFQEALRSLSHEERNLLRMHLIDGLNIDQIGALKQVHRATVARWIATTRDALFERTRTSIVSRMQLSDSEFASLGELLHSQMDVSVKRILEEER